jgi:hypothetical protein
MQNSERRDEDTAGIGIGKKLDRGVTCDDSSQPSPPASSSNGNRRWESHGNGNGNGNNRKGSKRRSMGIGQARVKGFLKLLLPAASSSFSVASLLPFTHLIIQARQGN